MTDPLATLADFAENHRAAHVLLRRYARARVDALAAAHRQDMPGFTDAARAFLDLEGQVTAWAQGMAALPNRSGEHRRLCAAALEQIRATRSGFMSDLCALGTADYKDRLVMVDACAPLWPLADALRASAQAGDEGAFRGHAALFAREARRCVRPPCGAVSTFVGEVLGDLRHIDGPWADDLADCVQISALTQMSVLAQRGHMGESSQTLFHAAQSLFTMARAQHSLPLPDDSARLPPAARAIVGGERSLDALCAQFGRVAAPPPRPAPRRESLWDRFWAAVRNAVPRSSETETVAPAPA